MTNGERRIEPTIKVYLGLGSNLGDREANLRRALDRINALGLVITSKSSLYETEPVGYSDQPQFLNQVIEITVPDVLLVHGEPDATLRAQDLLSELLEIERELGRERSFANGPRVIDIDLVLFGDLIIDQTDVVVPHPRMHLRRFVLEPLCEIAPEIVHPALNKTCRELLASLEDESWVRRYKPLDER
jgi:2-amino-4-hydroxy-6-hydroxymethyldihydropteridine diphosphokinase